MSKVIHIRDVPDEVHAALSSAAANSGRSLTVYLKDELELVARRSRIADSNAAVITEVRDRAAGNVSRESILEALDEGRNQ
ncbi:hypothetical protein D477_012385 [Arthrobacter crystallopoietes BAB-32]|uniref:Antitoxin FitA-like ribbon-helix-helix domain-containing protein n=1 Tax=Arthrobacter crystallopoietes BAB-32 TaxID=1246476 RepID=N1UU27_9MICC|nr:hypothetical protein [Arthrobacter crystallopoietes]EMY33926.1 hypothetical protein D477_012385 [Arthrobacter crystallopoietes BAB-32]